MKRFAWSGVRIVALVCLVASTSWTVLQGEDGPRPGGSRVVGPAADKIALEHYRKAIVLFESGKLAEADKEITEAISWSPNLNDAQALSDRIQAAIAKQAATATASATATAPATAPAIQH